MRECQALLPTTLGRPTAHEYRNFPWRLYLVHEIRMATLWSLTVRPATSQKWYCLPSNEAHHA